MLLHNPKYDVVSSETVSPLLSSASGTVVERIFGGFIVSNMEQLQAERGCIWAFDEWLAIVVEALMQNASQDAVIDLLFIEQSEAIQNFLEDDIVAEELLRPFSDETPKPKLNHLSIFDRWSEFELPVLPISFKAPLACRRYVSALNSQRSKLSALRVYWNKMEKYRRTEIMAAKLEQWAEWDLDHYARAMKSMYEILDIATLELITVAGSIDVSINLKDIFICQDARKSRPSRVIPKDHLEKMRRQIQNISTADPLVRDDIDLSLELAYGTDLAQDEHWARATRRPFFDIFCDPEVDNVVVLGDPGSGKSCLVRNIALCLLDAEQEVKLDPKVEEWVTFFDQHFPLLMELRKYITWTKLKGRTGLIDYWHYLGSEHGFGINRLGLRRKLSGAFSVVMFDGLDEIVDLAERNHVAEEIVGFSRLYPKSKIIVTSRIIGFDYTPFERTEKKFSIVTLDELNHDQIKRFSRIWFDLSFKGDSSISNERCRHLIESIETRPQLAALAKNPLLLTILAILAKSRELPAERTKLYDHALRVFCHQWDLKAKILELPNDSPLRQIEEEDKLELLRLVAWSMISKDRLRANAIGKSDLEDTIREYFDREWWPSDPARSKQATREMVKILQERNFILCHHGGDLFGFVHRTFLEYLCAWHLSWRVTQDGDLTTEEIYSEYILDSLEDEVWREIFFLLFALLPRKDSAALMRYLIRMRIEEFRIEFGRNVAPGQILAIECLGELRWKDRRFFEDSIQDLLYTASNHINSRVRSTLVLSIGKNLLDEARFRDFLFDRVFEERADNVKVSAIASLGWRLENSPKKIKDTYRTWKENPEDDVLALKIKTYLDC